MSFKILYVTATLAEAEAIKKIKGFVRVGETFNSGNIIIHTLVTGVGSVSTAWEMKEWIFKNGKPDLAINGGIAGSYNDTVHVGDVVMPVSDLFADSGIEDGDTFLTLTEAGLMKNDEYPYNSGCLKAENEFVRKMSPILPTVNAITVNTATGSEITRNKLLRKFKPDIETMEGATFFYICIRENIPFLALRAISNRVEPRNRDNWEIRTALINLSDKLNEVIIRLRK